MRIAPPVNCIPAYVPPVPVIPLSPEVSKALIAGGIFEHNANHVLWTSAPNARSAAGESFAPAQSAELPGGVFLQAYRAPQKDNSLLASVLDFGRQIFPVLDQAGAAPMADAVAIVLATPELLESFGNPDRKLAESVLLYGANGVRVLSILNEFAHIPHADVSLKVLAGFLQVGEQVFLIAGKKA